MSPQCVEVQTAIRQEEHHHLGRRIKDHKSVENQINQKCLASSCEVVRKKKVVKSCDQSEQKGWGNQTQEQEDLMKQTYTCN